MAIKNQIDHRIAFRKQVAAGNINIMTAGRHGRSVSPAQQRQRSLQRQRAARPAMQTLGPYDGRTIGERLGLVPPRATAKPLAAMAPPVTANVLETAKPVVRVDPPVAEGNLPPVAALSAGAPVAALSEATLSVKPRAWVQSTAAEAEEEAPVTEGHDDEETDEDPLI